jgi:hypothetical protein
MLVLPSSLSINAPAPAINNMSKPLRASMETRRDCFGVKRVLDCITNYFRIEIRGHK